MTETREKNRRKAPRAFHGTPSPEPPERPLSALTDNEAFARGKSPSRNHTEIGTMSGTHLEECVLPGDDLLPPEAPRHDGVRPSRH